MDEPTEPKSACGPANLHIFSKWWFVYVTMVGVCLSFAFLAAGLTMGLIALEPEKVRNMLRADEGYARDEEEKLKLREQKKYGKRVLPLIENHHRLLVTLLLTNSLANEALPIFLNRLVPTWLAVIVSTSLVLIFGEVIPSAIFTGPSQLRIVSQFSGLVHLFQLLLACIVRPIAALLDVLLGKDHRGRYHQGELVAMLESDHMEGCVEEDTRKMLLGALDLERKIVGDDDIVTPMASVFMLPFSASLDLETMARIAYKGYSRVLVYDGNMHNVRGMLIVKRLICMNPRDERKISTMTLRKMEVFNKNTTLHDALNIFQQGKSHLALVVSNRDKVLHAWEWNRPIPPDVHMAGIVTLESILEKILCEEIEDEDDRRKKQLLGGAIRSVRGSSATWDLSDPATVESLCRAVFSRWKLEWKLARGIGRRISDRTGQPRRWNSGPLETPSSAASSWDSPAHPARCPLLARKTLAGVEHDLAATNDV